MRFWRLEVPFAMPPLVWNMMMSMSAAGFRGRIRSDQRRRYHRHVPGIGSISRSPFSSAISAHWLGHRSHARRDPNLRSAPVSSPRGLGGPIPVRARRRRHISSVTGSHDRTPVMARRDGRSPLSRFFLRSISIMHKFQRCVSERITVNARLRAGSIALGTPP